MWTWNQKVKNVINVFERSIILCIITVKDFKATQRGCDMKSKNKNVINVRSIILCIITVKNTNFF